MKNRLTPRRLSWFGWFMGRVFEVLKIAVLAAVVIGLGIWLFAGGYTKTAGHWTHQKIIAATAAMGLKVADVTVVGRNHIDAETLRQTIAVSPGDPLMGIDIHALQARITSIAWVKSVHVRRALPDHLIVTIDERLPVAIWKDAPGGIGVIDDQGVVLSQQNLNAYGQLLAVEGKGAEKEAGNLIALLKGQPDIAVRVKKASRISERRWDLALDGGTILRLPEDDPGFALARASKAQAEKKILDQHLRAVDLRQNDRIILENSGFSKEDLLLKDSKPI